MGGTHISTDGITWTQISTAIASELNNIKWLRGLFVGVGWGVVLTSPDGVVWTRRLTGIFDNLNAVGASEDEYLIGGANGTLLASQDGITWVQRTSPTRSISAIEHRFGRWVMATIYGIHHSVDGISWTLVPEVANASLAIQLVWTENDLACTGLDAITSDGINWRQLEWPRLTVPNFKAIEKGSGGYVAVGAQGAIWHSPDGYSWQELASPTNTDLVAVASRPGGWTAIGNGGVIVTSSDGIQWSLRASGTLVNLRDIAWNGQRFAVVGDAGTILTSSDGQNWSGQSSGSTAIIENIESTGLAFKAFAAYGNQIESPDGLSWTSTYPDWIADVVWNGSNYVAVAGGGQKAWAHVSSPDALQWTRHPIDILSFLSGICWTGTQHVACGTNGAIMTSPDGVTWTQRVSGTTQWIQAINWNGSQLVAVGQGGIILVSPDGITWTKVSTGNADYEDVAWADGRYVVVGRNHTSTTSTNGLTWQNMTGFPGTKYTVERVGTRFLAAGESSFASATATTWQSEQNGYGTIYDLEWNGSLLFAATQDGVHRFQETAPGQWSRSRVHASPWLDNMTRRGNEFVATGAYGTVVLSRDGNSWQTVKGGRNNAFDAVASDGNRFVGVGSQQFLVSPNGADWSGPATPIPTSYPGLNEVIWTGSRFIAMGSNKVFISSENTSQWTPIDAASSPSSVEGIAGDDSLLVAVGKTGMIAISHGSGRAGYYTWMTSQGMDIGSTAPLQDANNDNIPNLVSYMLGIRGAGTLTPAERSALPAVSWDADGAGPIFSFELRESYRPGATYHVEVSRDLQSPTWQSLQQYATGWASGPGQASVTESPLPGGGIQISIANFPEAEVNGHCFFRLRTSLP